METFITLQPIVRCNRQPVCLRLSVYHILKPSFPPLVALPLCVVIHVNPFVNPTGFRLSTVTRDGQQITGLSWKKCLVTGTISFLPNKKTWLVHGFAGNMVACLWSAVQELR